MLLVYHVYWRPTTSAGTRERGLIKLDDKKTRRNHLSDGGRQSGIESSAKFTKTSEDQYTKAEKMTELRTGRQCIPRGGKTATRAPQSLHFTRLYSHNQALNLTSDGILGVDANPLPRSWESFRGKPGNREQVQGTWNHRKQLRECFSVSRDEKHRAVGKQWDGFARCLETICPSVQSLQCVGSMVACPPKRTLQKGRWSHPVVAAALLRPHSPTPERAPRPYARFLSPRLRCV